ncbi:MAG: hypothetical protein E7652_07285 [Ruminococcaceae bacterium]|nr:hypothetical protein [Oscillospiraceae bacterium]
MEVIGAFISDFVSVFVDGLVTFFKGIFMGIVGMFNFPAYFKVFGKHSDGFGAGHWILAILVAIVTFALLAAIVFMIYLLIRKYIRFRESLVTREELLEEMGNLNREIVKLTKEKERILAMKVSQLGLRPDESNEIEPEGEKKEDENDALDGKVLTDEDIGRFYKLKMVDKAYENYTPPVYNKDITLPELCDMFRNFACSRMGLFYEIKTIRLFIASFASTRLLILQGISGTGKTSLPYAFGKFIQNDTTIASVQPSWRDRTEIFGYFNEFTKRFNETEVLKKMYEAKYTDDVYLTILDEMNIARVEYYFAELLSILEMPTRDEWVVDLVPSAWPTDPKMVVEGRMTLPQNMWYIGTANNDDSTFAITDKVYDRAMPIDINTKGKYFEAPYTDHLTLSFSDLESKFDKAKEEFKVSQESLDKIAALDDYVIEHFRLAFGNRIVKQLKDFVPAYVGCGGTEIDGLDYVLKQKVFRKFESLNLSFIRDEIDGLISYMDKMFGKQNMQESKEYLLRLKKLF